MSYVEHFAHDIFVSYAHVDDEAPAGVRDGWVTTVIRELERQVRQLIGDKRLDLWRDPQLEPNVHVSRELDSLVGGSAVLVVVLSEGWLNSPWCADELDAFVRTRGGTPDLLFVIEKDRIERERWPEALRDLRAREFWYEEPGSRRVRTYGDPAPDPVNDRRYYHLVNDLGIAIEERLRAMRTEVTVNLAAPGGARVFLAEVTDDLVDDRDRVRCHLEQQGIEVFPKRQYFDPAQMPTQMREDMQGCRLFVQLLGSVAGRPLDASGTRLPTLQSDIATELGIAPMKWHASELDVEAVKDDGQRALLLTTDVYAESIELFAQRAVGVATAPTAGGDEANAESDALLFLNHAPDDRALAEEVGQLLADYGVGYALPLEGGTPAERREDLEHHLAECDGLLLVYGASPVTWVRNQLLASRKALARRSAPPARALCEFPPPEKQDPGVHLPGWKILNFRTGLEHVGLRTFVDSVPQATLT